MMGVLLECARDVLTEGGWQVVEIDGADALEVDGIGAAGDLTLQVHALEHADQLAVYASLPERAEPGARAMVAELFARANWGLAVGSFEIDLDDGEMRFRTGADFEGDVLRPATVRQMVRNVIVTAELFRPAIERVAAGQTDTKAVLSELG